MPRVSIRTVFALIILLSIIFFVFTLVTYIFKDNFKPLNDFVINYFNSWNTPLTFIMTFILAFSAFWVISDTRYFRYLDEKTKTVSELSSWCAEVIRNISIPALQADSPREIQKNIVESRTNLIVNIAQSISIFAAFRKLASHPNIKNGNELTREISIADRELRDYMTYLFSFDIQKITNAQELDDLVNRTSSITEIIRKLLEKISPI
jgi:hypothetical protein